MRFRCLIAMLAVAASLGPIAARAGNSVSCLRDRGPEGLAAALDSYDRVEDEAQREALAAVVDQVAGQRGATVSRLYWYTELDEAKEAAAASGKPILSLRMLGKLTDQYSCANSRFFRTALYSNKEISDYLRGHYVLHWESVRPVPRITIDFGDGRTLERTITGNSAHYVLDASGRPIEALPGLYGPTGFFAWLKRSEELAKRLQLAGYPDGMLRTYHQQRLDAVNEQLASDLQRAANSHDPDAPALKTSGATAPTALEAAPRAETKTAAEAPLLEAMAAKALEIESISDAQWRAVAALHAAEAKLDETSRLVILQENPAVLAGDLAFSKRAVENPLLRLIRNFEESMALDAVKNEYALHRQIHAWFANGVAGDDASALNQRVYAELFLTPASDPWLGLAPEGVYTALEGGGLTVADQLAPKPAAVD